METQEETQKKKINRFIPSLRLGHRIFLYLVTIICITLTLLNVAFECFPISDIMMPEIDGFEFAQTVREVNKSIPILFMSAKDDLLSKQRGFQLGIDDYMVKPIELDELLLRVRALLRRANIEMERKITVGNLKINSSRSNGLFPVRMEGCDG